MWIYEGSALTTIPEGMIGFVYLITRISDNKAYVGKKLFYQTKRKQVKGKVKRVKVESDWQTYWGSSEDLKAVVEQEGAEAFVRTILHLCTTKGQCNYLELREQIDRRVLEYPDAYWNRWISARVTGVHIKMLHKNNNSA